MGEYQFEVMMGVSELIDIEADSYDEALAQANEIAESGFYCVSPDGYSIPWDSIDVTCIAEPDEEDE
jgi:hypothetical protein